MIFSKKLLEVNSKFQVGICFSLVSHENTTSFLNRHVIDNKKNLLSEFYIYYGQFLAQVEEDPTTNKQRISWKKDYFLFYQDLKR